MREPCFARRTDVLWRQAPDRVLVRLPRPGDGEDEATDLLGLAALAWLALDEPGSTAEVYERLTEEDVLDESVSAEAVDDAIEQLVTKGWVRPAASS